MVGAMRTHGTQTHVKPEKPVYASDEQKALLQATFEQYHSISKEYVQHLSAETGLSADWIGRWFCRARHKAKINRKGELGPNSPENVDPAQTASLSPETMNQVPSSAASKKRARRLRTGVKPLKTSSQPKIAPAWSDLRFLAAPPPSMNFTMSMGAPQNQSAKPPPGALPESPVSQVSPADLSVDGSSATSNDYSPLSTIDSLKSSDLSQSPHLSLLNSMDSQQHDAYIFADGSYISSVYHHYPSTYSDGEIFGNSSQHGLGIEVPYITDPPSPLKAFQALDLDLLPSHPRSQLVIPELSLSLSSSVSSSELPIIDYEAIVSYHSQMYTYHLPYIFNAYGSNSSLLYPDSDPAPALKSSPPIPHDTSFDELDPDFVEMVSYISIPSSDAAEDLHGRNLSLTNFSKTIADYDSRNPNPNHPLNILPAELDEARENPFDMQMGLVVTQTLGHKSCF